MKGESGGSGREERQKIQPSGTAVVCFGGVDRVALNAEHHWTPTGGLLSVGLCVCVCSETRPTSDPCTTHTLLYLLPFSSSGLNPPIVRMRVLES